MRKYLPALYCFMATAAANSTRMRSDSCMQALQLLWPKEVVEVDVELDPHAAVDAHHNLLWLEAINLVHN